MRTLLRHLKHVLLRALGDSTNSDVSGTSRLDGHYRERVTFWTRLLVVWVVCSGCRVLGRSDRSGRAASG